MRHKTIKTLFNTSMTGWILGIYEGSLEHGKYVNVFGNICSYKYVSMYPNLVEAGVFYERHTGGNNDFSWIKSFLANIQHSGIQWCCHFTASPHQSLYTVHCTFNELMMVCGTFVLRVRLYCVLRVTRLSNCGITC